MAAKEELETSCCTSSAPLGDLETTVGYIKVAHDNDDLVVDGVEPEHDRFPRDYRPAIVRDVRGHEDLYTLDGSGFQWYTHRSSEREFVDPGRILAVYYPEMERFLKEALGASDVVVYHHLVRREGDAGGVPPVPLFHMDSSLGYAQRLAGLNRKTARLAGNHREMHVNAWRPIRRVQRSHLAVVEAHSVGPEDEVPITLAPARERGARPVIAYLRHSARHRFFYKSYMDADDVLVFKSFDSKLDGRARRTPHGAVNAPNTPYNAPPRESIEVRAMVFFHGQARE